VRFGNHETPVRVPGGAPRRGTRDRQAAAAGEDKEDVATAIADTFGQIWRSMIVLPGTRASSRLHIRSRCLLKHRTSHDTRIDMDGEQGQQANRQPVAAMEDPATDDDRDRPGITS